MAPVVTSAPNITNILCWKIAPKPLVYIDPRMLLNYNTFIPGETIWDWIIVYFQNFAVLLINRYLTVYSITIVFPQVPLFKNLLNLSIHYFIQNHSGKVQIPKRAPSATSSTAYQIAGKSWNHRGQYWTLNRMPWKPWISHPSVGQ